MIVERVKKCTILMQKNVGMTLVSSMQHMCVWVVYTLIAGMHPGFSKEVSE